MPGWGWRGFLARWAMFKFSIREVFLLTAIVALACGWGLDHWHMRSYFRFMEGEAESAMNLRIMCQEQEGMILDLIRERQELVTKRQPDNN